MDNKADIERFLHCMGCISAGRGDKVAVGFTTTHLVVWCEACDHKIMSVKLDKVAELASNILGKPCGECGE